MQDDPRFSTPERIQSRGKTHRNQAPIVRRSLAVGASMDGAARDQVTMTLREVVRSIRRCAVQLKLGSHIKDCCYPTGTVLYE